jgi:two-component system chemotaxis sensor kinase CheA
MAFGSLLLLPPVASSTATAALAEVDTRAGAFGLDAAVWRPFWSSLIHVIRNCVDHGLYSPEALPAGHVNRVVLSAERRSGAWVVEVADNGRGIDWEGLRRSLARRGLPCETEAELWEGIFVDGVSSRTTVSATSGRGVGMAAVRHEVERRGGRVSLVPGVGTTWRFTFPSADAVALAEAEQAIGPGPAANHQAHA